MVEHKRIFAILTVKAFGSMISRINRSLAPKIKKILSQIEKLSKEQ